MGGYADRKGKTQLNAESIRVGVLFSQTGPMAVTEKAHLQGILLACDEINVGGGIDGRKLEPIIFDPGGSDEKYAEFAAKLLVEKHVNAIFGTCLSTSRKAVLPVVERFNGVLFYPSVYEGFEYSPHVIYGGAVPNQVVLPLLDYVWKNIGKRVALVGSDTLYAREVNRIVDEFLYESGTSPLIEKYFPLGSKSENFANIFGELLKNKSDVVISTVVGEDSIVFYDTFYDAGFSGERLPIASLTTTEAELARIKPEARSGHISVVPYFSTLDMPANGHFRNVFAERYGDQIKPGVYSEVCYCQVHMFAGAIRQSISDEADSLLSALSGSVLKSPAGDLFLDISTNHSTLRPLIGRATRDAEFEIIWRADTVISPDPYLVSYDRSLSDRAAE